MRLIIGRDFRPYRRTLERLRKKYRNVESDLEALFRRIAVDPEKAANPILFPGTDGAVKVYRCRSSDQRKGSRGGFRVLCFYIAADRIVTIWPLLVYAKSEQAQRPSQASVRVLVREITEHIRAK